MLENVKNLQSHDKGKTFQIIYDKLTSLDYHVKYEVLNLDMRLFKIRDFIKGRCARVAHIDTTDNVADMFTKPLDTTATLRR